MLLKDRSRHTAYYIILRYTIQYAAEGAIALDKIFRVRHEATHAWLNESNGELLMSLTAEDEDVFGISPVDNAAVRDMWCDTRMAAVDLGRFGWDLTLTREIGARLALPVHIRARARIPVVPTLYSIVQYSPV